MFLHESLLSFDINLFSIMLLTVLLAVIQFKKDIYRYSTKLLRFIIGLTMTGLIIEPIIWYFDPATTPFETVMNVGFNYLLPLIGPVLIGLWGSYLDYKLYNDRKRLKKRWFYMYPAMIMFVLLLINIWSPILFYFDQGVYIPATTLWIGSLVIYPLYLYFIIFFILNRPIVRSGVYYGVFAFFLLPLIGMILQMIEPTIFFTWTTLSLCAVVVYIFLETTTGIRDYLTKLYSRRTLEDYVMNLMEASRRFTVVMLDINQFKAINDTYGHQKGDLVLIEFSNSLRKTFSEEKMIPRYGGDEFFVVVEKINTETIKKRLNHFRQHLVEDDVFKTVGLKDFSVGMCDYDGQMTIDELFLKADQRMYLDKPNV